MSIMQSSTDPTLVVCPHEDVSSYINLGVSVFALDNHLRAKVPIVQTLYHECCRIELLCDQLVARPGMQYSVWLRFNLGGRYQKPFALPTRFGGGTVQDLVEWMDFVLPLDSTIQRLLD